MLSIAETVCNRTTALWILGIIAQGGGTQPGRSVRPMGISRFAGGDSWGSRYRDQRRGILFSNIQLIQNVGWVQSGYITLCVTAPLSASALDFWGSEMNRSREGQTK